MTTNPYQPSEQAAAPAASAPPGPTRFYWKLVRSVLGILAGMVVVLFWMQESILRTSQARLGERILRIEALLREAEPSAATAFQLHSEGLAGRGAAGSLVAEYARHALRPTVAFPYVVLLLIQWAVWLT